MSTLLSDVDNFKPNGYQTYSITLGIEIIEVLIPLKNTILFETALKAIQNPSYKAIINTMREYNGELQ